MGAFIFIAMKKYLLFFIIATILYSCQSRVELSGADGTDEADTDEYIDVNFVGDFGDFATRSTRNYPTEEIQKRLHRIKFNGLRIVLYSVDETNSEKPGKVAYVFDKDVVSDDGNFSGQDFDELKTSDGTLGFNIRGSDKIKKGDYFIFVFTSPNTSIKAATEVGQPYLSLRKPFKFDNSDFRSNLLKNNIYYNSEPIKITGKTLDDVDVSYNKVVNIRIPNLSPVSALLSVDWQNKVNDSRYELLGDFIYYYPDVQNKSFLLFPEMDEGLQTKYNLNYPVDGNYTGFASKGIEELSSVFQYRSQLSDEIRSKVSKDANGPLTRYRLVPENTMAPTESNGKVITRVILKVRMIPVTLKEAFASEPTDKKWGWVNYQGVTYTESAFLEKYNAAVAVSVEDRKEEDTSLINAADNFIKNGAYTNGYEDDQIQYYRESYVYYSFPITHFKMDQIDDIMSGGYYGVVRNHHYHFNINSFATIGRADYRYLGYDVDYINDGHFNTSFEITDMTEINTDIDILY